MNAMQRICRTFRRGRSADERGASFVLTAICMVLLLWGGAMGVDIGFDVWGGRTAQAMADTGALDMARYISIADSSAYTNAGTSAAYLDGKICGVATDNGGNCSAYAYQAGYWNGSSFSTGSNIACYWQNPPRNPPCNAVSVTATQTLPLPFAGGSNHLSRTAIAAVTPEGGFSIGTYLLSLDTQASALSDVFGAAGASTSLKLVGYQGLASANVTVAQLIAANPTLFTPTNVMTVSLSGTQWVTAWQNALSYAGDTTDAATLGGLGGVTASAKLCQMVSINGSTCNSGSLSRPALSSSLDVLQMLTTEAEVADQNTDINLGSTLGIPGIANTKLSLSIGQVPQVAYGPVGSYTSSAPCPAPSGQTSTCASTAQVTATIKLSVNLLLFTGEIDISLTAAQGTATLKSLTCSDNQFAAAKISTSTTAATATFTAPGQPINPIANLPILSGGPTDLPFNPTEMPPPNSKNPQTVSAGMNTTYTNTQGVFGLLSPVLGSTLPSALYPVLRSLGIQVGGADVTYTGTNCGAVSIVK
jgi:uncharacterized membrane protein